MANNLEQIGFEEVIDHRGRTYAAFRKELIPDYSKIRVDLAKGFLGLLISLLVFTLLARAIRPQWPFLLMGSLFTGYALAYLHLFIHEAAHYNLHGDKRTNDKISDWMIGVFFGISVRKYRKIHWLHHLHLGSTVDTEHSYFHTLNPGFLLKVLSGLYSFSVILSRSKTSASLGEKKSGLGYLAFVFSFQIVLGFLLFLSGGWVPLVIWGFGLLIFFPFFATLRQILEHRSAEAAGNDNFFLKDHGKISRLFGDNILDSSFGSAGFNKHLIHHWDPVISYTRLKDVELFLAQCPKTSTLIHESRTHYTKVFSLLFKLG
jgi:fatty acid desaturase